MNKQAFIQDFLYQQALLSKNKSAMVSFAAYLEAIGKLRHEKIKELRALGINAVERAVLNNALQQYSRNSYRRYLFALDPRCQLCLGPIKKASEATIDHIIPLSKGGKNENKNKQLAHWHCNGLKGNRNIRSFEQVSA